MWNFDRKQECRAYIKEKMLLGTNKGFRRVKKFRKSMIEMCVGIGRWAAMGMKTLAGGLNCHRKCFLSPNKKKKKKKSARQIRKKGPLLHILIRVYCWNAYTLVCTYKNCEWNNMVQTMYKGGGKKSELWGLSFGRGTNKTT